MNMMSDLTRLEDDHDRYQHVYRNGFSRIAMKDVLLKEVSRYFDNYVVKNLTDAFSTDGQFDLLGVGVGEGPYELHFLQSLGSHFKSLRNVAVEPNESFLQTFKRNATAWSSDAKLNHEFHGFNGTLSHFFDESPLAKRKYNIISAIHSLYYMGDMETTFTRLTSMLKDKGFMIIVLAGSGNIIIRTHHQNPWLPSYTLYPEKTQSQQVLELAQREGYTANSFELDIKWDFTDVFDEKSEQGDLLVDFLTMTAYFRNTAPAEKLEELMSFWRSFCSEDEDGRIRTFSGEKVILISK